MRKNEYFENMRTVGTAFGEARELRRQKREEMVNKGDWDGVKEWDKYEKEHFPYPYTAGQCDAFRAYDMNLRAGSKGFFEVKELPWENDTKDFVETMKAAGIQKFLVTDESTALMRVLFELSENGCKVCRLRSFKRMEHSFCTDHEVDVRGIVVKIVA